ncbi:MAG TPA: Crp/Fnr family transcriptional regulator [Thermomicrobiales bacterium]|jgi:CRP/FNR family transcriptional regulator|nr:Crp/Fnr family transcriptional regulator [Thermomicrobiales bacterium]
MTTEVDDGPTPRSGGVAAVWPRDAVAESASGSGNGKPDARGRCSSPAGADSGRQRSSRGGTVRFAAGQEIFRPGRGDDLIHIVRSGCVRLYKSLPDGRRINLGLLGPNTVFVQEDPYDGLASGASAEALTESIVTIVHADDLAALLAHSPELATAMVRGMTRRLTELQTLVEHLLARDASVRLATTLIALTDAFGQRAADGLTRIAIPLTHQSLANMIGANRVTVTRKLLELEERGMVQATGRSALAVDPDALRRHARAAAVDSWQAPE